MREDSLVSVELSVRGWTAGFLGVLCLAICMVSSSAASAERRFDEGVVLAVTDVSAAVGIEPEQYRSPTEHSLSINWVDVDDDGWVDLFAVNGVNREAQLYHNRRDGTFEHATDLLPPLPNYDMTGAVYGDYDNDGDSDIYIYTDNEWFNLLAPNVEDGPPNLLLKNLWVESGRALPPDGQPLFEEVAEQAGLADLPRRQLGTYPGYRAKAASWFDYDRDGCLDLYVGHLTFQVEGFSGNRDRLYRNRCDGTFEDATELAGIYSTTAEFSTDYRPTLATFGGHIDDDLWPDLYLVNASPGVPGMYIEEGHIDRVLLNNGDGTFRNVSYSDVGDDAQAGMGITVADIELDGDWDFYISDLYVHNFELEEGVGNALYLGGPEGLSSNRALARGVSSDDSWGVNFFDFDQDGYEDLFVGTFSSARGRSYLYMNEGDGTFLDYSAELDLITDSVRGSAVADYDHDGDLDLALVNQEGTLQVFRNDSSQIGNSIQLKLIGEESNRDAIGALVTLRVGDVTQRRQVLGGASAHSQDSLVVHFGIGAAVSADEVTIFWPSGIVQRREALPANKRYTVTEESIP